MTLGTWNDRKENDVIDPNDINSVAHAVISLENSAVEVDQTYNSTSQNAQSGTAVAQAIAEANLGSGGGSNITFSYIYETLSKNAWHEPLNMSGVNFEISNISIGVFPQTMDLKVLLVDVSNSATLEQRKAAEEACIYADYSAMQPNENDYDYYAYIGITSDTAPTVDIPITITAIFEG